MAAISQKTVNALCNKNKARKVYEEKKKKMLSRKLVKQAWIC